LYDLEECWKEEEHEIDEFIIDNEETISKLENVYIESRYLPVMFFKDQIENMIIFVRKLKELTEK